MAKSFPNTGATVIDSAADLPAASAALEGILMFQKDTNELKICDGSSWKSVIDTDTPPGLTMVSPTSVVGGTVSNGVISFSSTSAISINNCFSSAFSHYRIICKISGSSVNFNPIYFRTRSSGSDYSGANYYYGGMWSRVSLGTGQHYGAAVTQVQVSNAFGDRDYFTMDITNPFNTITTNFSWNAWYDDSTSQLGLSANGAILTADSYDGFVVYCGSGTFIGNIRVYGYRDSI